MSFLNHFKNKGKAAWIIAIVSGTLIVTLWIAFQSRSSPGKDIELTPADTSLGPRIKMEFGRYHPPIWTRGSQVLQGAQGAPWLKASLGSSVRPGDPEENMTPFVTESFMQDDFSLTAYEKSQEAMVERGIEFERSAFYWVEIQTQEGRFMIVAGVPMQLLNAPPPDANFISANLYEEQNGRWLLTSTRRHRSLFSLPWKDLAAIEQIIVAGSAKMNEYGMWEAVKP